MMRYWILVLAAFLILSGCGLAGGNKVKGEYDLKGIITDIDTTGKRILVEDQKVGLVWISLPEGDKIESYQKNQTVVVWTDGKLRESYPMQATGLNIEQTENPK